MTCAAATTTLLSAARRHGPGPALRALASGVPLTVCGLLAAAGAAHAQPTTTDLGRYTLCRTSAAGQGCHELQLTTAPRVNAQGVRDGTTGTLTLRNLQGSTYTAPNGASFATGTGASILTGVIFYTQGCLPNTPCASPDYFDGVPFGAVQSGPSATAATGPVAGTVPAWTWNAAKPLAGDNPNTLRFDANSRFINNNVNVQLLGIGGCAIGGGQYQNQFRDVVQETRTCDAQGFTGAVQYSFTTNFVFDPTYFMSLRVDWAQQTTPGIGDYAQYFCSAGASRRGEALLQTGGGCSAFTSITAVPEPAPLALLAAGLAAVVGVVRRRRPHA